MNPWRVLVVEDDLTYLSALEKFLKLQFEVVTTSTVRQAMQYLKHEKYDLGLIDLKLPDGHGFDVIKMIRKMVPEMMIIVMTGYGTVEIAVKAIQKGAFHYLMKPFPMERLAQLVCEAQKQKRNGEEADSPRVLTQQYHFEGIIGQSPPMLEIFKLVEKVANSDSTILIRGESGTGKELIANAIHIRSHRRDKPFVTVNCGALQEELLESELFGHVRGAFTGAIHSRKGRFEIANGGTVFLDEVGDMSPRLQVKLLRVLQEQQFELLGRSESIRVNVRIIAATHQDLELAVSERRFREDLYYRLNVIPVFIPSLRERSEDVGHLLNYFLEKFNQEKRKNVRCFSEEARGALCRYPWPGNVRELENLVERLVILKGEGIILAKDLPDKYFLGVLPDITSKPLLPVEGTDLNEVIGNIESELIRQALQRASGNCNKAARLLKLKRTTLVEKLRRKKIMPKTFF